MTGGNQNRRNAIVNIASQQLQISKQGETFSTEELFRANVFDLREMQKRLPKAVYRSLLRTVESGQALDATTADAVASAMKEWAIAKGATHYTHVFYPLTGLTAEKHDSFLLPSGDGAISEFSGAQLIQGEPDGSSFPTGGIRQTFEARGYTAWDVTSPAYLLEGENGSTLCIPTAFVSWTGEALDQKTPLLRSMQALNLQVQRVLKLFGQETKKLVVSTAGAEQEYFLVDSHFYYARPDLLTAGRTLFGASSPKGQEFDDHYFGAINDRALNYMIECEKQLLKLGVPVKTRHNEVAPGQYEIAPIYENANVATDHQQLIMSTLQKVVTQHGFVCLLHEKPFAGVNGSGKHVNFSMGNAEVGNLLEPGDNPQTNMRFLVFCAAVIQAVSRHARLLRAVVASAGNDHRLGANEAPPAIISIFLGDQLTEVFDLITSGSNGEASKSGTLTLGVDTLPRLPKDAGDRNRTSPFAFTGNKFEFRAVGSAQSIATPLIVLNTILAESLDDIATSLEAADGSLDDAITQCITDIYKAHKSVIFNGDGYSDEWHKAAVEERGLDNLRTTADALPSYMDDATVKIFEKYNVLSPRELESRMHVYLEQYAMSIQVEARLTVEMGRTMILPASLRYLGEVADTAGKLKAIGRSLDGGLLDAIAGHVDGLQKTLGTLEEKMAAHVEDPIAECRHACDEILPAMNAVREHADALEGLVADDLWPLPTYEEMLFIK